MLMMFRSLWVAAVVALIGVATPVAPAFAEQNRFEQSNLVGSSDRLPAVPVKAIRKIRCTGGHGSGFVTGTDTLVTAYHVVANQKRCVDDETGEILTIVTYDANLDIAVLRFATTRHSQWLKINCRGYETGHTYYSFGFAGVGDSDLMMTRIRALEGFADSDARVAIFHHMRELTGVIIPGMSGGPIIDDTGQVVGMNNLTSNAYRNGLSREMKDTYFCKR